MSSRSDIGGVLAIGLLAVMAVFLAFLVKVSSLTGLPFLTVMENARVLWVGPGLLFVVFLIEKTGMQLPIRLENTWPVIVGVFWIAIHRLLVMKEEQAALEDDIGVSYGLSASPVDYPWYAQNWALWCIFLGIIVIGYCIRNSRHRF